jgi:hypothetical protein
VIDERSDIARLDEGAGFVTYSRIDPQEDDGKHGPILTGIEVPPEGRPAPGPDGAPDVRADERVVPAGRRSGRRAFGLFAVVALVAFAGGVGVLAGSFLFPTIGEVIPIPGGGKAAAVTAEPEVPPPAVAATEVSPPVAEKPWAEESTAAAKVDADRFAELHAPDDKIAEPVSPAGPAADAAAEPPAASVAATKPEPAPVPRSRPAHDPEPDAAEATVPAPVAAEPATPAPDAARPQIAALPSPGPAAPSQTQMPTPLPQPNAPDFRADASNDPLALPGNEANDPLALPGANDPAGPHDPAEPVASADHVPPAEIPERSFGAAPEADGSVVTAPAAGEWDDDPYQAALDRWAVLDVRDGRAVIDGRERGVFMVVEGSEIPGVGIVEEIRRMRGRWAVVTTGGSIYSVERVDRRRFWLSRIFD